MRFACPACKTVLQAPEDRAGSRTVCPTCRQTLQVPAPPSSKPTAPAPVLAGPSAAGAAASKPAPGALPASPPKSAPAHPKPAAAPPSGWIYAVDNKRQGPVSWEQLQQLAASGKLQRTDKVWTQGMPRPADAGSVPNLFPAAGSSPETVESFEDIDPSAPPSREATERLARKQREQPTPVWKKALAETAAVGTATFHQTVRPIRYLFAKRRRSSLSKRVADARLALGQRLYDTDLGDAKLRSQIRALGERILGIEAVKGVTKDLVAERRELLFKLADPVLARPTPPPVESEHQRARAAGEKLHAHEEWMQKARPGLRPSSAAGWRRVAIGYTVSLGLLALVGFLLWPTSGNTPSEKSESGSLAQTTSPGPQATPSEPQPPPVGGPPPLVLNPQRKDTEEIVELCGPSVALIRFGEGGGTGFMVAPGIIATNAHVIDNALIPQLKVYFPSMKSGSKDPVSAELIYFDRKRDLAFLKVPPLVPALPLAPKFEFKSGQSITIIGCPGVGPEQLKNAVNTGVLSTEAEVANQKYYQLGASVNPGNSGGPVFDRTGHIIGVVTLKAGVEQISYCIPWNELRDHLEKMKAFKEKDKAEHASQHRAHAAFHRARRAGAVYIHGMRIISAALQTAQDKRLPEAEVVRAAKQFFEQSVPGGALALMPELDKVMPQVGDDLNINQKIRERMVELWKNCKEMKESVDNAKGPVRAYNTKRQDAEKKFRQQVEFLANSLGTEEHD